MIGIAAAAAVAVVILAISVAYFCMCGKKEEDSDSKKSDTGPGEKGGEGSGESESGESSDLPVAEVKSGRGGGAAPVAPVSGSGVAPGVTPQIQIVVNHNDQGNVNFNPAVAQEAETSQPVNLLEQQYGTLPGENGAGNFPEEGEPLLEGGAATGEEQAVGDDNATVEGGPEPEENIGEDAGEAEADADC